MFAASYPNNPVSPICTLDATSSLISVKVLLSNVLFKTSLYISGCATFNLFIIGLDGVSLLPAPNFASFINTSLSKSFSFLSACDA